jgi:Zn-dependent M28 family amino/carboxypeptidase
VFAAFTAEESGLIGSSRFVEHPPVPLDQVAYMLNLDMVGRVRDNVLQVAAPAPRRASRRCCSASTTPRR